mmetsp:Transcript_10741/g.35587  ORF Transcript_10741/g.35587 Transcript_10741/m.35587 type:complete len:505 (+) Transcript_10741:58-1572(+)
MAWVSSLQSQLEKVQSSIDSRLDKSGVPSLAESMRSSLSVLEGQARPMNRKQVIEATPEPASSESADEVESSGYADLDEVRRARAASEACERSLAEAAKGAAELALRSDDLRDGREARAAARKAVAAKVKAWKGADSETSSAEEVVDAATEELGLSARRARDAEAVVERAVELCGEPATRAATQYFPRVVEALRTAERELVDAKRRDEDDAEAKLRSMADLAKLRAADGVWRLARAALLADMRRTRLGAHLGGGIRVGAGPSGATSGKDADDDQNAGASGPPRRGESMTLRAALLALRLETLETQRSALSAARSAATAAHACGEKARLFAKKAETAASAAAKDRGKQVAAKARRSAALESMDPARSDRELRRAIDDFEATARRAVEERERVETRLAQAERDGAALADAATAKLAAANRRVAEAEARCRELEKDEATGSLHLVREKREEEKKKERDEDSARRPRRRRPQRPQQVARGARGGARGRGEACRRMQRGRPGRASGPRP